MLSIKFLDENKNSLTVINTYLDLQIKSILSNTSTAQFTIPYTTETVSKLKENVRKVGNIVEIWANIEGGWQVFVGKVRKTKLKGQYITFDCIDLVSYYRSFAKNNKKIGSQRTYESSDVPVVTYSYCPFYDELTDTIEHCPTLAGVNINEYNPNYKGKISGMVEYYHNLYGISDFSIGFNGDERDIDSLMRGPGDYSFFDIMKYLEDKFDVFWRSNGYQLDIIGTFDEIQPGLRKYDYQDAVGSYVIDFDWEESLDSQLKNEGVDEYPAIKVEDPEWYKYRVGNKKAIQINTQLEGGSTGYVGMITEIDIKATATKVVGNIKVDNTVRKKTKGDLRYVLENLHNRAINNNRG